MSQALRKLTAAISRSGACRDLHQPDPREDRRHVRQSRDHAGRARAEVLRLGAARHPPHRTPSSRARSRSASAPRSRSSRTSWPRPSARRSSTSSTARASPRPAPSSTPAVEQGLVEKSRHLVHVQERAHRAGPRERQEVAAGKRRPAHDLEAKIRETLGLRAPAARARQSVPSRAPRRALDLGAARLVAADLLSRRAWTCAELTARLRRRGASPELAGEVVADLVCPRLPRRRPLRPAVGRGALRARLWPRAAGRRAARPRRGRALVKEALASLAGRRAGARPRHARGGGCRRSAARAGTARPAACATICCAGDSARGRWRAWCASCSESGTRHDGPAPPAAAPARVAGGRLAAAHRLRVGPRGRALPGLGAQHRGGDPRLHRCGDAGATGLAARTRTISDPVDPRGGARETSA